MAVAVNLNRPRPSHGQSFAQSTGQRHYPGSQFAAEHAQVSHEERPRLEEGNWQFTGAAGVVPAKEIVSVANGAAKRPSGLAGWRPAVNRGQDNPDGAAPFVMGVADVVVHVGAGEAAVGGCGCQCEG